MTKPDHPHAQETEGVPASPRRRRNNKREMWRAAMQKRAAEIKKIIDDTVSTVPKDIPVQRIRVIGHKFE
jgi:hypothetical protein